METRCELNPVLKPQQASKEGPTHAPTATGFTQQFDIQISTSDKTLSSSIGYKLVGTASKAHTHAVTRD